MVDTSQSMRDYVENFRANLPAGITYDPILSRYFCNDRRFLNEWEVERYLNYIKKFGFTTISVPAGAIQQRDGAYILDRSGNYIEVRA